MPDNATKRFVNLISSRFTIPAWILTDGDPYGIAIASTYIHGSLVSLEDTSENKRPDRSKKRESNHSALLTCPEATWIGLKLSEAFRLQLGEDSYQELTGPDELKARSILASDWIHASPSWK